MNDLIVSLQAASFSMCLIIMFAFTKIWIDMNPYLLISIYFLTIFLGNLITIKLYKENE